MGNTFFSLRVAHRRITPYRKQTLFCESSLSKSDTIYEALSLRVAQINCEPMWKAQEILMFESSPI